MGLVVQLVLIYIAIAATFLVWQHFVAEPKQRERMARINARVKRDREEAQGLWYGDDHTALRARHQKVINAGGGQCMERLCIWPTRRIGPNTEWHLAHDHAKGGPDDYLGPAHAECNVYEALTRGRTWPGAPTVDQVLKQVEVRSVGSAALPQMSSSTVPPNVPPSEVAPSVYDPQPQDPQTIVRTAADYVSSSWSSAERSDLTRGWLSLVATPRGLQLKFKADTGTSWARYASKIYEVALVAKGPNVIIEIVFKHPGEPVGIRTIVGPKGRIGEICRLLGYPIL